MLFGMYVCIYVLRFLAAAAAAAAAAVEMLMMMMMMIILLQILTRLGNLTESGGRDQLSGTGGSSQ